MTGRPRAALVLILLSAAIGLWLRIASLLSGSARPALDWLVVAFWFVVAGAAARVLVRR
jgi:hypothetical protein